ncbi:MAG TPA: hypothetical protein VM866_05625, partial [Pyrinomonadaceae bacterium]|nr:hypothetical protein [Pyrinomonadaceae bacterium]
HDFDPARLSIEDVIPKRAMGDANSIHDLQNYVIGLAPGGLVVAANGSLDTGKSFARVNYFQLLGDVSVRNNVQPEVSDRPIDFVAARISPETLHGHDDLRDVETIVWLSGGRGAQALILARKGEGGKLLLRYLPVSELSQNADGRIEFARAGWRAGLPLKIIEDPKLEIPNGASRAAWLDEWHTDLDWLRATHRTTYSNAVIGLHEQLARHQSEALDFNRAGLSDGERLIRRFRWRQRMLVEADLLIVANNHWNFDVRGFNPGGNHGSFFRVSTHSTLMFAGGSQTGIPRGLEIEEPYDGLSFVPTILALTGQLDDGRKPVPALWRQGFRTFPGRIIKEIMSQQTEPAAPVAAKTENGAGR